MKHHPKSFTHAQIHCMVNQCTAQCHFESGCKAYCHLTESISWKNTEPLGGGLNIIQLGMKCRKNIESCKSLRFKARQLLSAHSYCMLLGEDHNTSETHCTNSFNFMSTHAIHSNKSMPYLITLALCFTKKYRIEKKERVLN